MIVMLNLLIAIIGETFAKVNAVAVQSSLQQQAAMIAENDYLIPAENLVKFKKDETCFLVIATKEDQVDKAFDDPRVDKLD